MKNVMSIDSKKLVLIEWISRINDFAVIDKLIELKEKEIDSDNFLISRNEQNSIDLGIEDANNGKLTAHSEVKKIYEKWL
ncbi:hypothetical protein [Flavobacterium ardleyense]|uniref:hypothetical protein n=1 Tax=Flavobacterium ardleyense TaxID=2038737 RepID=UPI00298D278D|nr:hypothetical protein [Flavobacterium ardleyense]